MRRAGGRRLLLWLVPFFLASLAAPAYAYVGPGAGFALVTSALVVAGALFLAFFYLATWPARVVVRAALGRRAYGRARCRRLVILGLDGLDAGRTEAMLAAGELPHLARLHFRPLGTTLPPLSPVAWSTFQTGLDPAGHGLFDFLRPARPGYGAELASVRLTPVRRHLPLGPYRLPLGKPRLTLRRRGVPFWRLLGEAGIFSAVIRVPITYPPERTRGVLLSGMCVPDLRGTQGSFTCFSEAPPAGAEGTGVYQPLSRRNGVLTGALPGPPHPFRPGAPVLRLPLQVRALPGGRARLTVGRETVVLEPRRLSDWVELRFRAAPWVTLRGLVRFCLLGWEPCRIYVTPIHLHPEKPAQPLAHPAAYSVYLAKRYGPYATLGLAEDTWALNEGVLDEELFLAETWAIHAERETMFFDALERVRRGLVVCVFDGPDRIQHMFMRTLEPDHPANRGRPAAAYRDVVPDLYRRMDTLVGRVLTRLGPEDVLLVLSDHGFGSFRRGVNLNAWLREEGYLVLRDGAGGPWFAGVDWRRTRAYAVGLAGIYLNLAGRERHGVVGPREAPALRAELKARLEALRDPAAPQARPVRRAYLPAELPPGPYRDEAPDVLVGYGDGYRISWAGATGHAEGPVFEENTKPWSGDHCLDPALVPGVLFSNRPLVEGEAHLRDLAPTALALFGVPAPPAWRGRPLVCLERS